MLWFVVPSGILLALIVEFGVFVGDRDLTLPAPEVFGSFLACKSGTSPRLLLGVDNALDLAFADNAEESLVTRLGPLLSTFDQPTSDISISFSPLLWVEISVSAPSYMNGVLF